MATKIEQQQKNQITLSLALIEIRAFSSLKFKNSVVNVESSLEMKGHAK